MKLPIVAMLLVSALATETHAASVNDKATAIKNAQSICRLQTPSQPGQWQAALVKNASFGDEWHVWFGKDRVEPVCGFYGAVVKTDGSYTSCRVSACRPAPAPNPKAGVK
jgi:hypothetical protein